MIAHQTVCLAWIDLNRRHEEPNYGGRNEFFCGGNGSFVRNIQQAPIFWRVGVFHSLIICRTPSAGMGHQPNKPAPSYLGSEMAFTESLGVYPMGSFGDTTPTATETDSYYNPVCIVTRSYADFKMLSRNYSTFSQVSRGSPISPFNGPTSEERPLYSRHSLGVFGYGESSIEPCRLSTCEVVIV